MPKEVKKPLKKPKAKERSKRYQAYQKYIRSKKFKIVKKAVEERDGYACAVCGRTRTDGVNLTCHHKTYAHLFSGGQEEINDCVTLCTICHRAVHSAKKNYLWFAMENPRNNDKTTEEDETEVL